MTDAALVPLSELQVARPKTVSIGSEEVVVVRTADGVLALQRRCPHMGADLGKGSICNGVLVCPRHKAAFDLATGNAVDSAHFLFLKFRTRAAKTFPVRMSGDGAIVGSAGSDTPMQGEP